jgi:hypothetical protein
VCLQRLYTIKPAIGSYSVNAQHTLRERYISLEICSAQEVVWDCITKNSKALNIHFVCVKVRKISYVDRWRRARVLSRNHVSFISFRYYRILTTTIYVFFKVLEKYSVCKNVQACCSYCCLIWFNKHLSRAHRIWDFSSWILRSRTKIICTEHSKTRTHTHTIIEKYGYYCNRNWIFCSPLLGRWAMTPERKYSFPDKGQRLSGLWWRWSLWLINKIVLSHSNPLCWINSSISLAT